MYINHARLHLFGFLQVSSCTVPLAPAALNFPAELSQSSKTLLFVPVGGGSSAIWFLKEVLWSQWTACESCEHLQHSAAVQDSLSLEYHQGEATTIEVPQHLPLIFVIICLLYLVFLFLLSFHTSMQFSNVWLIFFYFKSDRELEQAT